MTKNLKLFFIFFVLFFVAGLGINKFEKNLTAQLTRPDLEINFQESKPVRNGSVPELELEAESAISILLKPGGEEIILFEKARSKLLPVASLIKLMTAKIVLENYNLNEIVQISQKAASLPGNGADKLKAGQVFRVIDLLYPALIESNNTAAYALAEIMSENQFVDLMNSAAGDLEMGDTIFLNPTGLDQPGQYSTAQDLVKLTKNLLEKESFIWNILSLPEIDLYSAQGDFVYTVKNTNELLGQIPSIIGGKTGETPTSGGCLILVTEAPKGQGYLINIILNSENRFEEMKKLIDWDKNAYGW